MEENGYRLCGDEPLKITVNTSDFGKSGFEFAENLRKNNAECEFCDRDFVVMMVTPEISDGDLEAVKRAFVSHDKTDGKSVAPITALPVFVLPEKRLSVRQQRINTCRKQRRKSRRIACRRLSAGYPRGYKRRDYK